MTRKARSCVFGVVVALGLGCGGDATGADSDGALGTWSATKIEIVNTANSSIREDLISQGYSLTLAFSAGGTWVGTSKRPGEPAEGFSGVYVETGSTLTLTQLQPPPTITMDFAKSISGNRMTLTSGDEYYDFGAGLVLAKSTWTLRRQ